MAMQRNGVPKAAVDCFFSTLQHATHQVRTGYGDSETFYGGSNWTIPMHGIGQGNGAGPAIWAVLSTPIRNMLRKQGFGCEFAAPISNMMYKFVGYSFVDDTDLIQSNSSENSYTQVINSLQQALDIWEGGLKATCGAIVPEKTFWHMVDFHMSPGHWNYKLIHECPGSIFVNDIHGQRQEIRQFEASHAETTLGVDIVPDGNCNQQFKKTKATANKWADGMRTGKISPSKVWLAITSTIWRTLSYPLPATNLTKQQCEAIMYPILLYSLPAMGICRYFPRKLVFAPTKYMGLGMKHLYTVQEILRLKDIIDHTYKFTTTGKLYKTSLELLLLELGMGTCLHNIPFDHAAHISTDSLIKSSWQFLNTNDLQLHHDITFTPQRTGDKILMCEFLDSGASKDDLLSLNRCRLYLKAYFLSDITNGYGTMVTDDAWMGRYQEIHWHTSWPKQAPPTRHDWIIWRTCIKRCFLSRGMRLKHPLGKWIRSDDKWPWYYSTKYDCLYHIAENGCFEFSRIPHCSSRLIFTKNGIPVTLLSLVK
jgi:hypothetical protein